MRQGICILGSTGSIGQQSVDVALRLGLKVKVLAASSSAERMYEQIRLLEPELAVLENETRAAELRERCRDEELRTRVEGGRKAVIEAAAYPGCDIVIAAMVGMAGLEPVLKAIEAGRDIALANKETLVVAGNLVMSEAQKRGVSIYPVDSEHSAIWQCLAAGREDEVDTIYLTCSGGPFRGKTASELANVTEAEALAHPTWKMGGKISIDSATLMNKGLELIEACHLFGVDEKQVEIVVHPESIIHSMVGFRDHSVIAQLGFPDMRLPIQLALTYPERLESPERRFNPFDPAASVLRFYEPDVKTFYTLDLARKAQREGRNLPIIMNAANEVSVAAFLAGQLRFLSIMDVTARTMDRLSALGGSYAEELSAILELDRMAREVAGEYCRLCR